jgi:hypothetical protein
MSHHHDHDHDHDHDHHHHKHGKTEMTVLEKAVKIIDHWIRHNEDHSKTYREWADKLKKENLPSAAALIDEVAAIQDSVNEKFQQAVDIIRENF